MGINGFCNEDKQKIIELLVDYRRMNIRCIVDLKDISETYYIIILQDINDNAVLSKTFKKHITYESSVVKDYIQDIIHDLLVNSNDVINNQIPELNVLNTDNEVTSRFMGAVWFPECQNQKVTIGGAGGIGSHVAILLSRLYLDRIDIYDNDIIEGHNMSGQFYSITDIGKSKVDALRNHILNFSNNRAIGIYRERINEYTPIHRNVIACFDNMESRILLFESWENRLRNIDNIDKSLFIDGRLSAEEFQIFCIRGDDTYNIERYKNEFLFNDNEVEPTLCSYKQTSHIANMIASCIVNLFTNHLNNLVSDVKRNLPFFTYYNGETMLLKTEL